MSHTDQIAINFKLFHAENPHVYAYFRTYTRQMIERGFEHGSASLIFERIRWEIAVTTSGELKLNNNYRSRYSRLWMRDNPDHPGFFRTRKLSRLTFDSTEFTDIEDEQRSFVK